MHEGSYTGDNTDNRSITGGTFAPAYALVKSGSSGNTCDRGMQRPSTLGGENTQYFNNIANTNNSIQALQADGLQLGTACHVNANGTIYHWMAFRQN